ncbi:MAG: 2-phosphosulfolactate phosphatase [Candidatus Muiribacteriaceae bacterium]
MLRIFRGKEEAEKAIGNTIIVDIVCATTVMTYFLHKGAESIIPASQIEDVIQLKKNNPDFLVAGDYAHEYRELFDVDIFSEESFRAFDPSGKNVIYISYNGTRRIIESINSTRHYLGSFLNLSALIEEVRKNPSQYCFLLAMSESFGGDEDEAFADYFNLMLKGEPGEISEYLLKVTTSNVVRNGSMIFNAPYLVEMAVDHDLTDIVPFSLYDEELGMMVIRAGIRN